MNGNAFVYLGNWSFRVLLADAPYATSLFMFTRVQKVFF